MARTKKTEAGTTDPVKAITEMEASEKDKRIADLEAKLRGLEEKALERVCAAMGLDATDIKTAEGRRPAKAVKEPRVRMFVQNEVNINGEKYIGDITVPLSTSRVIQQAIGDRRMRLLRELTGNNYILQELAGGGFAPRLVGQIDINGEQMLGGKRPAGALVV